MERTSAAPKGFYYGWVVVAVALLALIVSNGLSIGGIPVFYKSIREDFVASGAVAADRAESFIAFGATLTFLFSGLISPLAGWLIEKISIKHLMLVGCFLLGGGLVLHSQTSSPAIVYSSRIALGVSLGFVGVLPSVVLVSNWFVRRRGTALGLLLTGTSIGGAVIPPMATPLVQHFGWRSAMLLVSLLIWLVLVPAVLFLVKDRPSDVGLIADGDAVPPEETSLTDNSGLTLSEALRTPVFWMFALGAALIFYPIFVTTQQFILYLQTPKIGLTAQQGSFALSALFAASVGGKFLFGFLSDRLLPVRVMLLCCLVMFLSTFILLNLTAATALLFVVPFGFGYGGTFVLIQRLAADFFGPRDYPKILGVITIGDTLGAAFGGLVTGRLADSAGGDYTVAFYAVIGVTAVALLLVVVLNVLNVGRHHTPAMRSL
jgi:MFS family permease